MNPNPTWIAMAMAEVWPRGPGEGREGASEMSKMVQG